MIHCIELPESGWWGCEFPERPHDIDERWDTDCPRCRIRMTAVMEIHGDLVTARLDGDMPEFSTLGDILRDPP